MARYHVGIDLGTTNTAVASTPVDGDGTITPFPVPQVTSPGEVEALSTLPSFLLLPTELEVPPEGLSLPWSEQPGLHHRHPGPRARLRAAPPAGLVRQVVAVPHRRRPARPHPALARGRDRGPARRRGGRAGPAGLAGRGLGAVPRAPARRLEPRPPRRPAGGAGGVPGGAGLVRRRRPRADHDRRPAGRADARSPCWRSRRPPSTPGWPRPATAGASG